MTRHAFIVLAIVASLLVAVAGQAQTTSRSTYAKLIDVQELWSKDKYDEALAELEALAAKTKDKEPYDYAIAQQYIAHTAILSDHYERARPALEKALAQQGLPKEFVASLKLDYGQIVLGSEEYELARKMLEDWYRDTEVEKQPSQVFSLAYANYMTGHLPRAEELLENALAASKTVNNTWYRIYYQVLFEQKKYEKAESVVYGLVSREPANETYWQLLVNYFLQRDNDRDALAAMAIARVQGLMTSTDDLKRLATLYSLVEIPEKAARLLQGWVEDGTLKPDADTLHRIGNLWLLARDREQAKVYLGKAAAVAKDGKTYELLASINFEDEEWRSAYGNFMHALKSGGLDDNGYVYLLAGISAYRAGMDNQARAALEKAKASKKYRAQALGMLRKLNES
jgi:hypothetical protein